MLQKEQYGQRRSMSLARSRRLSLLWAGLLMLSLIGACAPVPPTSPYFAELRSEPENYSARLLYDRDRGVGIEPSDTAIEVDALLRDGFLLEESLLELEGFVVEQCGKHMLPKNTKDNVVIFTKPASFFFRSVQVSDAVDDN